MTAAAVERGHAIAWTTVNGRARTPQDYACLLAARRQSPSASPRDLVETYRALRKAGTYAPLDELLLSAGQIAELAIVVNGGTAGVNGGRLDGAVRASLARLHLTAVQPGSRWGAEDWRATVIATLSGVAVVRGAQGHPVTLNTSEAVPLAVIERAMRTSTEGGTRSWPGNALALRVAQMWRLVEQVRIPPPPGVHWSGRLGKAVYRLTPQGTTALERHRRHENGQVFVTARSGNILEKVDRSDKGDLGRLESDAVTALQKCLDAGWVREGERIPGTERRSLRLTEAGREAVAAWRFQKAAAAAEPPRPTVPVPEIQPGQWVRLSNRKGMKVGPEWVQVVEKTETNRDTPERLAHNYEVWVTSDDQPMPFLYVGRALFRTVRFEVKAL